MYFCRLDSAAIPGAPTQRTDDVFVTFQNGSTYVRSLTKTLCVCWPAMGVGGFCVITSFCSEFLKEFFFVAMFVWRLFKIQAGFVSGCVM